MLLQRLAKKLQCRPFVPLFRNIALQYLTLMVDSAPEIMRLAIDVRYAALRVTNISSRCQRQCRKPFILEARCRRMSEANNGPNLFHQNRTVSWQMSIPRSNRRSSTLRKLSGNRTYIITTSRMTSGDELKRLKGLSGLALELQLMRYC